MRNTVLYHTSCCIQKPCLAC